MKQACIVYASRYGSTRNYANWLAEALQIPACPTAAAETAQLEACRLLIFGGGLYAERLNGIGWLERQMRARPDRTYLVFACGLSDPQSPETCRRIQASVQNALPQPAQVFYLRGGMDYARLGRRDRMMMALFCRMLRSRPAEAQSEQVRQLLASYGKSVDYTDPAALAPLIEAARKCSGCFT